MSTRDSVEQLADAVARLEEQLASSEMEPDPGRRNWAAFRREVDGLEECVRDVGKALGPAWCAAESTAMRPAIADRTARVLCDAAIVLRLASREEAARHLLSSAQTLATDGGAKDVLSLLRTAESEPELAARQAFRRWLSDRGRFAQVELLDGAGPDGSPSTAQRETPVSGAPTLFRLNGCGVGLYGHTDERPDGSYLAAYCVSVVFIPVYPIRWYRVTRDGNLYRFLGEKPLGLWGRVLQGSFFALMFGLCAFFAARGEPRAAALAPPQTVQDVEAQAVDASPADLLERYVALADEHADDEEGRKAAGRAATLLAAEIPAPCSETSAPVARSVGLRFRRVPAEARSGETGSAVREGLLRCAQDLREHPLLEAEVLSAAMGVATDDVQRRESRSRRTGAILPTADAAVTSNPLFALGLSVSAFPEEAPMSVAQRAIVAMGDSTALMAAAEPQIRAWLVAARDTPKLSAEVAGVQQRLDDALARNAELAKQVTEASDEQLAAMVASDGHREEVALPASRALRDQGLPKEAIKTLSRVGGQGRMTWEARVELASYHRDAGDLDKAQGILVEVAEQTSAQYKDAAARFDAVRESAWDELALQARRDRKIAVDAPLGHEAHAWVENAVATDPRVKNASAELASTGIAVRASIALASVALERMPPEPGAARDAQQHIAENALLQLRAEAAGDTRFDIQLAVVLHRVGKSEQGERELKKVLDGASASVQVEVALAYRSVGMRSRARQVAEQAYAAASTDRERFEAADLRAVLWMDPADHKRWLERCDLSQPGHRRDLRGLEASLALRAGRFNEAEGVYAELVQGDGGKDAADSTELNNVALLHGGRYEAAGDIVHLRTAVRLFSRASALAPDSPVILSNLCVALEHVAAIETLERWVHTRVLHLSSDEAVYAVLDVLLDSKVRTLAVAALRRDPSLRRMLGLRKQQVVLAPQDAWAPYARTRWLDALSTWSTESAGGDWAPSANSNDPAAADAGVDAGSENAEEDRYDDLDAAIARVELAREHGHAPTLALARLLLVSRLRTKNRLDVTEARASEMIEHVQLAAKEWPAVESNDHVIFTLIEGALQRSLGKSAVVKAAWESRAHRRSAVFLLHHILRAEGAADACGVLRADPAFEAAVKVFRTFGEGGGLLGWELARVVGDDGWRRRAAAGLRKADYSEAERAAKRDPGCVDADVVRVVQDARADVL